ncbi:hypothetical protein MTO96_035626 [Rhipicephalus appendiculatus]
MPSTGHVPSLSVRSSPRLKRRTTTTTTQRKTSTASLYSVQLGWARRPSCHQFLYDEFPFHTGEFEINGASLTMDIVDTSGSYPFPAMRRLAITTADAFVLIYAVDDPESFEEVRRIHDQITELHSGKAPVVVVGNKCDLPSAMRRVRREGCRDNHHHRLGERLRGVLGQG